MAETLFLPNATTGLGLHPRQMEFEAIANTSFVEGELCTFDLNASGSGVSTADFGQSDSIFANVVSPNINHVRGLRPALFGVIGADVAAGQYVNVTAFGNCKALVDAGNGIDPPAQLVATTALTQPQLQFQANAPQGNATIAIAREDLATGTELIDVFFFGMWLGMNPKKQSVFP